MGLISWIEQKARTVLGNRLNNKITRAFYQWGAKYTQYDKNNTTYIDKGYNTNPDVYAVVSQKASEVTRIPYCIKSIKEESNRQKYIQFVRMVKDVLTPDLAIKKSQIEIKAFEEKELSMPLERPNPQQTWMEFLELYSTYMDLTGDFYMYLVSPLEGMNSGTPVYMYILPSQHVQIVLKKDIDILLDEDVVDYYILTLGNSLIKFKSKNVVHVKKPNPNFDASGTHLYGQSPLRAVLRNIQSSNSAIDLNVDILSNGGSFGFISTKEPLTAEQAQQLKDRLVDMDNSEKRLSNIAGSAKEVVFTRISLTTDELKPFDYLKFDQKAICNVLHWDSKLLNSDEGAKYDNYKIALRRAITSGVSPSLRLLEEAFNNEVLPRFKGYENTILVFDELCLPEMQEDMEKLSVRLKDALDRGVINRNEYRKALNYSEVSDTGMDEFTVSMNVISLSEAIEPTEEGLEFGIEDTNI